MNLNASDSSAVKTLAATSRIITMTFWCRSLRKIVLLTVCTLLYFANSIAVGEVADETRQTEVIVLSTLHQLHGEVSGYSYDDLSALIEMLEPDLLAVELTAQDLESRRAQRVKQEYQESVFPLLDKHNYEVIPLEPAQPLYDEIVGLIRAAHNELNSNSPQLAEAFNIYSGVLYEMLREDWTSPRAVNSRETDRLFESKHRFQSEIFGPKEKEGWARWNQHFLDQIVAAATRNPGKRLVVLVGAEHSYWLREHLRAHELLLLDTEALLD